MIINFFILHIKNISYILLRKIVYLFHIKSLLAFKLLRVYMCVNLKDNIVTLKSECISQSLEKLSKYSDSVDSVCQDFFFFFF